MMALFAAGPAISWGVKLGIASTIATAMVVFSVRERRSAGWRWMGAGAGRILFALFTTAMIALFLFVAATSASPLDTVFLAWFLIGLAIGLMNVLTVLRIVRISQAEIEMDCRLAAGFKPVPSPPDTEPTWKKVARTVHSIVFVLVWLAGIAAFYMRGKSVREGSPGWTPTHTDRLVEHGQAIYVTPEQTHLIGLLDTVTAIGIPLVVATAFALHFLVGVRLFPTRDRQ
jgi:hypothetical protein